MGADVGVVSRALLRKAHTAMAEGSIAAAPGSLDATDEGFARGEIDKTELLHRKAVPRDSK